MELAGLDFNLQGMASTSNLSSVMDWKNPNRILFQLKMQASNTFLNLCYEDKDSRKLLASAQFQNFLLGVTVRTQDFSIDSSLGACTL